VGTTADPRVQHIRRLWAAYDSGGVEAIRGLVDEGVTWLPYGAGGEALRGFDQLSGYLTSREDSVEAETYSFESHGDAVLVTGRLRLRAGVSLTHTQLYWIYHFRDDRLVRFEAYTDRQAALNSFSDASGSSDTGEGRDSNPRRSVNPLLA
jgi:ketosteroid isomerase-like protein